MATYEVTDPQTGQKLRLTGDSPPTEQELEQIFASAGGRAPTDQPQTRSAARQVAHEVGYGAGQLYKGVMGTLALPIDLLGGVINYLDTKTSGPTYEVTIDGKKYTRTRGEAPTANQTLDEGLSAVGVPVQPENRSEEVMGSVARSVGGAMTGIGVGNQLAKSAAPVVSGVGRTLAANPALQGVSAVTGAAGAETAKEFGGGPVAQTIAGFAGAMAPAGAAAGPAALTRAALRGGEQGRQRIVENVENFRRAGTAPTVGQATESRINRSAENLLSRTPGGAGPIVRRAEAQAEEVGTALEQRAQQIAGRATSAEQTGRKIQQSVRGDGGFVDRFKKTQSGLYDQLDKFIPNGTRVAVERTKQALSALNASIPGAPSVSKFFQNARIKGIEGALKSDTEGFSSVAANPEHASLFAGRQVSPEDAELLGKVLADGRLPYEALKKLRTLVGNEIADSTLASDVPRSKWNALYAALSDDLGEAVKDNPEARAAWTRANGYTRAGMRRIEAIESVIDRSGGPEAIFRAATAGTREGASTLRAVMQSTDDEGRRMITATVLRRLGRAKAGVQGELGDQFSAETFLTNWNGLSTEAKRTLFNRYGDGFRSDMDQIAKFAANLRQGSQVFRNPSGTAQASTQAATVGALAMAAATGHLYTAGGIAAGVGAANLTSRLMANPEFVRWLAQSTKVPIGGRAAMVNQLVQRASDTGDLDLARFAAQLEQQVPNDQSDQRDQQQRRQ